MLNFEQMCIILLRNVYKAHETVNHTGTSGSIPFHANPRGEMSYYNALQLPQKMEKQNAYAGVHHHRVVLLRLVM